MNIIRRTGFGISVVLSFWSGPTAAQVEGPHLTLTPFAGGGVWADDVGLQNRALAGARGAVMLAPWIGIEGTYGTAATTTRPAPEFDTKMTHLGVDLVIDLLPFRRLRPYVAGGWSQLTYDSDDANDVQGGTAYVFQGYEVGCGMKMRVAERQGFRADVRVDARDVMTELVQWFPNAEDRHHNWLVTAGLQFAFGRKPSDTDRDGIIDRADLCDDTPTGAHVNVFGCAIDSDADGVVNGLDRCDDTPTGAVVDGAGCPRDSDSDGVVDGLDLCEETPVGAGVNWQGCPSDGDSDGVPDGLDRCPETLPGASVDTGGCATDSDGDGVVDGLDLCANTPLGAAVDRQGCSVQVSQRKAELLDTGMIRLSNVRFGSGRWDLPSASFSALDEIGEALVEWPDLKIEIAGHTDSTGPDEKNRELSALRAKAVLDYLAARFPQLRVGQYLVVGHGEGQPIADNTTSEGRGRNRRVEFRVLNGDQAWREGRRASR